MPIVKLGRLKCEISSNTRTRLRWSVYLALVIGVIVLGFIGYIYKPAQQFTFVGQMTRGTVVSFEAQDLETRLFVTATLGLDSLASTTRMVVR